MSFDFRIRRLSVLSRLGLTRRAKIVRTPFGDVPFRMPQAGNFSSFYLFALHKSGSTLLNEMMSAALNEAGVPQISLAEIAFSAGIPDNDILNPEEFIFPVGYCYRGYREFPPYLAWFDIAKNKKILLVRDPRDMLVSNYFSVKISHLMPVGGVVRESMERDRSQAASLTADEHCLAQAASFKAEIESYNSILQTELRIYKYEYIIFKKHEWLCDMLDYLQISLPSEKIADIAKRYDVIPDVERPGEHIRQVNPGNYKRHLSRETIAKLNHEFATMLATHNYDMT